MKTSEGYGLVRKTMLIFCKLNDLDRPDDIFCHNLFPFVHIETNFCSAYLNPALCSGLPFSQQLTTGPAIPFLCICRLLQFHKNPLFHQEALLITLVMFTPQIYHSNIAFIPYWKVSHFTPRGHENFPYISGSSRRGMETAPALLHNLLILAFDSTIDPMFCCPYFCSEEVQCHPG